MQEKKNYINKREGIVEKKDAL